MEMEDNGYLIRKIGFQLFEISKWGEKREPLAVYNIRQDNHGWSCNSPGCSMSGKQCKHVKLLKEWLKSKPKMGEMPTCMLTIG